KPKAGERYALLVGVRKYDPNELRDLPYSEADVTELAGVLKGAGYKPDNVVLMTQTAGAEDTRFLPIASNIRKELRLLLQGLDEQDSIMVALAGHGVQFRGEAESFFCPAGTKLSDRATLIPLAELYKELESSGAALKLLLVDACRNDPQSNNSRARAEVDLESVSRPQRVAPPGGVVAFFSCSEGQKAFEHSDLKHGVFFHFVIEALKGSAVAADERELVLPDLEKYVKRNVRDFVRAKYGIIQTPELRGTTRDLVPLVSLDRGRPRLDLIMTRTAGIRLKLIPAGEFQMGSANGDDQANADERPQHRVRITKPFYLGVTEVTRGQFRVFVDDTGYKTEAEKDGKGGYGWNEETKNYDQNPRYTWQNPGFARTDEHPVVNVSWNDAQAFIGWLSRKEDKTFRLPTEAEWEYACRAGTTSRYFYGDDSEGLAAVGNVADGTAKETYPGWKTIAARDGYVYTAPVGRFQANAFGLFDMHGNACEWCQDAYDGEYYRQSPVDDPPGPSRASRRVFRGGSWRSIPRFCRSAYRFWFETAFRNDLLGFRLALVQSGG
ncbi:MAG TPA: SUMF1/EgtB/PvdO family nonheme iron enzyme, partial [Isosphaeraceae bacterium]|nr:SUMF1/EgtB/PvdO family nonheme iron enzyme [Isosphaeraceae bacterium]